MDARAVVDTSVFVASESGRAIDAETVAQYETCVSIFTLTELRLGVAMTSGPARNARSRALAIAGSFESIGADERTAERAADILAAGRLAGQRVGVFDAFIAASAMVTGLPLLTQNGDFALIAERSAGALHIVRV